MAIDTTHDAMRQSILNLGKKLRRTKRQTQSRRLRPNFTSASPTATWLSPTFVLLERHRLKYAHPNVQITAKRVSGSKFSKFGIECTFNGGEKARGEADSTTGLGRLSRDGIEFAFGFKSLTVQKKEVLTFKINTPLFRKPSVSIIDAGSGLQVDMIPTCSCTGSSTLRCNLNFVGELSMNITRSNATCQYSEELPETIPIGVIWLGMMRMVFAA